MTIVTYISPSKRKNSSSSSSATEKYSVSGWNTTPSSPSLETSIIKQNRRITADVKLCTLSIEIAEQMRQFLISLRQCSLYVYHNLKKRSLVIDLNEQGNAVQDKEEIGGGTFDVIQQASVIVIDQSILNTQTFFEPLIQHAFQIKKQLIVVVPHAKNMYDMLSLPEIHAHVVAYRNRNSDSYVIRKYDPDLNLAEVTGLWDMVFGSNWPLSDDKIEKLLHMAKQPRHWVAIDYRTGTMVGFVATQIFEWGSSKKGELMLLMTNPNYENYGIGTHLHNLALNHLKRESCNEPFEARLQREKIWFGRIKPSQFPELHALQKRFPLWCETYEHQADLGGYQDFLVARQDNENGRILGSVILHTTHTSHDDRSHLVWTDKKLFTEASGGVTRVSVAEEERRRGIGTGLMIKANQILRRRGVKIRMWTGLT
ncbi:hypothetical protein BDB00DRAFT_867326 [Zychaea mexicana]|uniref:uncharacterized protein n=1 Tax=Zychaea mexicana TaxID=64656 RepID=UPI0022FEC59C|nr:uncharacterized protein BDB00DRAFT_867326 [Zychaea mexicana]KAI9498703.1 hypothetical protein BDB00DRAFT_867326 [Zychaea mexicana]